jgi:uncharacterized membrane protein YfcA
MINAWQTQKKNPAVCAFGLLFGVLSGFFGIGGGLVIRSLYAALKAPKSER